ncbi:MAG: hypothetical protein JWR67_2956, partial [Mucilaginibacter sp.]|nr:hypothetical protein [Mucilaginibacter sp.]
MKEKISRAILINKSLVISAMLLFSVAFAVLAAYSLTTGLLLIVAIIALPCIYASIVYPKFGIIMLILLESFIFWFIRMGSSFPLGTLIDVFQGLLLLGFLIKQKQYPNWKIYNNPVSIIVTIWIAYNFLQLINPVASSMLAWLYTIRSVALSMLMYYVFVYNLNSKEYIRLIIKIWLGISVFVALYAINQEFYGFFPFEEVGLQSEKVKSLLFI